MMSESTIRRTLDQNGYLLRKSRKKNFDFNDQGGYAIINKNINGVVAGNRFDLTLEDVEEWIKENL